MLIITISIIAVHNFNYLNKHRCCRNKLFNEKSNKYPFVKPEFYEQPLAQQTVENNHEIHAINKKLIEMEKQIEALKKKLGDEN